MGEIVSLEQEQTVHKTAPQKEGIKGRYKENKIGGKEREREKQESLFSVKKSKKSCILIFIISIYV